MKTLQKATLAVAIAAAPFFATNALEALDDDELSNMTGQAGVTIETQTGADGITIGAIEYTDTNLNATGEIGGGSLAIQAGDGKDYGIQVRGWAGDLDSGNAAAVYDRQTVDIDSEGNLRTRTVQIDAFGGNEINTSTKRIDVGNIVLRNSSNDDGAVLVNSVEMLQVSGASSADIINLKTTDLSNSAYYSNDANATAQKGLTKAADMGANIAIVSTGSSKIDELNVTALDSAVTIKGLKQYQAEVDAQGKVVRNASGEIQQTATGLIESTSVIWTVNGQTGQHDGVYIQGSDTKGSVLEIGSIMLGNQSSIGELKIIGMNQSGTVTHIYGH